MNDRQNGPSPRVPTLVLLLATLHADAAETVHLSLSFQEGVPTDKGLQATSAVDVAWRSTG